MKKRRRQENIGRYVRTITSVRKRENNNIFTIKSIGRKNIATKRQ